MGFVSVTASLTLNCPSVFGKMVYDHLAPVTGNKIIHMQGRTQPRVYCSTGSMTKSPWKFSKQSDDLVSR